MVGACGAMFGLAQVVGGQTHGVWLTALIQQRGLPLDVVPLGPTLFYLSAGLTGVLVGRALDQTHLRAVLITGTGCLAGGSLLLGMSTLLWQASLGFCCLGVGFVCLGQLPLGKILADWCPGPAQRRAMGVATLGPSLGAGLIWLFATTMQQTGLLAAGLLLATIVVSVMLPLLGILLRLPPCVPADSGTECRGVGGILLPLSPWTPADARQTTSWWALALAVLLVVSAQASYIIHAVPLYATTFGLRGAALIWTVSALFGALARLAYAALRPAWPSHQIASVVYGLEACGLALLMVGSPPGLLLLAAGIMGAVISLTVTLEPHVAAETFAQTSSYGVLYGQLYLWARFAAAGGALLSGLLVAATGDYRLVLSLMGLLLSLAAVSIRWATPLPPFPGR